MILWNNNTNSNNNNDNNVNNNNDNDNDNNDNNNNNNNNDNFHNADGSNSDSFHFKPKNDVPHGALKGGTKPSYRQFYNKTLKKYSFNTNNNGNNSKNDNDGSNKSNHLKKTNHKKIKQPKPRKIKQVRRKTTIKKYKLGKHGKTISILIKNNKTRKIIQNSQRELKNVPIHDVKNALIKNNLLKLGSTAPSNILRKIFEESNMTGEILNTGGDTFMHNYMNDNEKRKF